MQIKPTPYCVSCPYYHHQYVPPKITEQSLKATFAMIGEAPGREELQQGEYFVGQSGQVLDVIMQEAHIARDDTVFLNVVRCDPGAYSNVTYDPLAVEMCTKLLWADLETIEPPVIIPMGNMALQAVLGKKGISKARGQVTVLESGMSVVPTFHPAFILRSPAYAELVVADLDVAQKVSRAEQVKTQKKTDYKLFQTPGEVYQFFQEAHAKGAYSLDTETTSLDYRTAEVICLSLSHTPYQARVLPFYTLPGMEKVPRFWDGTFLTGLYSHLMDNPETTVYMQNGKFDLRILNEFFRKSLGKRIRPKRMHWLDTQNMGGLLNENIPHNLKDMSRLYTDIVYDQDELALRNKGQVSKMSMAQLTEYAGQDADATLRLGIKFEAQLREQHMWHLMEGKPYADMPVLKCLYEMELFGAPLSQEKMQEMRELIHEKLASLYSSMAESLGRDFNPKSSPQMQKILFEDLGFPPTSILTATGAPSTDKNALDELMLMVDHAFPKTLRLHRQYSTTLSTFIEGAEKRSSKSRLHPNFLSARTVSGRIVCVNPNLANIQRDKEFEEGLRLSVRGIYVARPGWVIVYGDWSQIEFKCAALIAGDQKLIHALFNEGADFHTLTAEALFPEFIKLKRQEQRLLEEYVPDPRLDQKKVQRQLESIQLQIKTMRTDAKVYNFGQLYGGGDEGLAVLMGISVERVQELTERRRRAYPELARFIEHTPDIALEEGELESAYGRKRRFPYTPSDRTRSRQGREGINFLPQSGAGYVGRAALVRICHRMRQDKLQGFPFNVVYDCILAEVPREETYAASMIMTREMTRPVRELGNRSFSVDFGIGRSWAEAEKAAVKVTGALKSHAETDILLPYLREIVRQST